MSKLKFLVVEDDAYFVRHIRKQIERIGYTVIATAGNVSDAIIAFNKSTPDIIIMDIELIDQKEGGIELAKIFKKIKNIPIIYYTNFIKEKDFVRKAIGTRPAAILSKKSGIEELEANIENVIHQFSLEEKDSFSLKSEGFYHRIFFKDISWIESKDKKTHVYTNQGKKITFSVTLSYFEKNTSYDSLQRISNSCIVNMERFDRLDLTDRQIIISHNGTTEALSFTDAYLEAIKTRINILKTR